jgi:pyruvate,water dikinase
VARLVVEDHPPVGARPAAEGARGPAPAGRVGDAGAGEPETDPLSAASGALVGKPVAPGIAVGRAKVVRDAAAALPRLRPGEILVVRRLERRWVPLLRSVGAVVAEVGNALSAPATVAREYRVPAVVGARGATRRIVTGQWLLVDGGAGRVSVGEGPEAAGRPKP